ncbi:hypothetical protein CHCC14562_2763 [Bacillus licheniformis]|nr:hypothetical protein CHCC14562_2763 [Bacillus licheniformis]
MYSKINPSSSFGTCEHSFVFGLEMTYMNSLSSLNIYIPSPF